MTSHWCYQNIGEYLKLKGLLSHEHIDIICKKQKHTNKLFGEMAVEMKLINENDLLDAISKIYNIESINLDFIYIRKEILQSIDIATAEACLSIVFFVDDLCVKVAVADPGNLNALDEIRILFPSKKVEFYAAKKSEIIRLLEIIKYNLDSVKQDPLLLLNKIIFDAVEMQSSDLHFEPLENLVRIRVRIHGILQILCEIDLESWQRIQSKLKLIANLNITENRRPQSGHARVYLGGKIVDLRISTHPGIFGENFVIRIFDLVNGVKSLEELNFINEDFEWLKKIISFPSGIVLVTGPTGSGKTTTLYALLKEINSFEINIMTLEDPVEYHIHGIRQLDLREEGILSFADGIRSILRQDPDVLLIGEIRDEATAAAAVRASLTGRLVLATLHASTPTECLRRLIDLGLKTSDFVPSLVGIFSQRLIRKTDKKGRFPLVEYIYFSEEKKQQFLALGDANKIEIDKTFKKSIKEAIAKKLTNENEIMRVFGNVYL